MAIAVASVQMTGHVASSDGARRGQSRANRGRGSGFELGRGQVAGQLAAPAYGTTIGREQGRREEEEGVGGLFAMSKFFRDFFVKKLSPISWPQMEKC